MLKVNCYCIREEMMIFDYKHFVRLLFDEFFANNSFIGGCFYKIHGVLELTNVYCVLIVVYCGLVNQVF